MYVAGLTDTQGSLCELLITRSRASYLDGDTDSRCSLDSATWTADGGPDTPRLGSHQDQDASSSECSAYSPSIASVRQAVVRARTPKPFELQLEASSPSPPPCAERAVPVERPNRQQPGYYRHSPSASLSSNASGDSFEEHLSSNLAAVLPGPVKGQRMQSFLAPKMTIHTPAPWNDDDDLAPPPNRTLDASRFRRNSSPVPNSPEAKRPRTPFALNATSTKRKVSTASDDAPFMDLDDSDQAHSKSGPTLVSKRKNSPGHANVPLPAIPTSFQHKPLPTPAPPSSLTSSDSYNSMLSASSSRPTTATTATTAPSRSSSETFELSKIKSQSPGQPLNLIPLNIAQERERERKSRSSTISHVLEPARNASLDGSQPSPIKGPPLRNKKSGFLKLFKKDQHNGTAPPLPLPSPALSLSSLPTAEAQLPPPSPQLVSPSKPRLQPISPISIHIPPPLRSAASSSTLTPAKNDSKVSFLPAPARKGPRTHLSPKLGEGLAPSLNLRPISMAFSDNFARDMLSPAGSHFPDSPSFRSAAVSSPTQSASSASLFDVESLHTTTPSTPFFPGTAGSSPHSPAFAHSPSLGSVAETARTNKMWEMEQHIKRLEDEVEALKRERDSWACGPISPSTCDHCGGRLTPGLASVSVLERSRPLTGASPMFGAKAF